MSDKLCMYLLATNLLVAVASFILFSGFVLWVRFNKNKDIEKTKTVLTVFMIEIGDLDHEFKLLEQICYRAEGPSDATSYTLRQKEYAREVARYYRQEVATWNYIGETLSQYVHDPERALLYQESIFVLARIRIMATAIKKHLKEIEEMAEPVSTPDQSQEE